ncbi:MAG: group 1 truncated hemoglobin [Alphaproteobacteria bacterium]|nr:group 1 truncated hemoglobin [Alphaproteobacteria bacterium]
MKLHFAFAFLVLLAGPAAAEDTLYADMGGKPGIDRMVDEVEKVYLTDPRIKDVFEESNLERLNGMLKNHFCMVAGGPCTYAGHSMEDAHKGLHLKNMDFNALVEDLQVAMDRCDIPFATQNRFLARLAPMQHQVVTR